MTTLDWQYIREAERKELLQDIKDNVSMVEALRLYEDRHYYELEWPSMLSCIKTLDKEIRGLVKRYEQDFGRKLSVTLIRRIYEL